MMEPTGQGWLQLGELLAALVLCSLIGLERQLRQKSAGLRTHTLVGLGSALFVLISKYGFTDVLQPGHVVLDPSRVAAQIVSGIGFIGGGLIFVRRDIVRGLTTAAVIWVAAAVGAACGAGLPVLAAAVTAAHFLVVYGYPPLVRLITRTSPTSAELHLRYADGRGVLRDVLRATTERGFSVLQLDTERADVGDPTVDLVLTVEGRTPHELVGVLAELDGVHSVGLSDQGDWS
ncbi:MAG TPA: MgtC/SapB family protein [Pseudonocardiaceae bacterium]|jgi:putative Mg2+ transporter-C (MgtC) family protein|nr:MgtC/SapB family protein [Pseudonocardiaceae bacterium]